MMKQQLYFLKSGFFILMGLIVIGFGAQTFFSRNEFIKNNTPIEATVLSITENKDQYTKKNTTYYAPLVEIIDKQGVRQVIQYNEYTNSNTYKPGDKLFVFYDPQHPENLLIDNWQYRYHSPLILFIFGLLFCIMGVVPLIRRYLKKRRMDHALEFSEPVLTQLDGFDDSGQKNISTMILRGKYRGQERIFRINIEITGPVILKIMLQLFRSGKAASKDMMEHIPIELLERLSKKDITVYVDSRNENNYYVKDIDLELLLEEILTERLHT